MNLIIDRSNRDDCIAYIDEQLAKHNLVNVSVTPHSIGKWTMTRLWMSWMGTLATHLSSKGITMPLLTRKDGTTYGTRKFNQNDAHDLFVSEFLGVDEKGIRLSFAKKAHDGMRPASKGERFSAMLKAEQWALERGIKLLQPRDSDYFKEKEKGNY